VLFVNYLVNYVLSDSTPYLNQSLFQFTCFVYCCVDNEKDFTVSEKGDGKLKAM